MTQSSLARWAFLVTTTTMLAGCGSVSSWLGLERHVPDESQVVVRPALTLPPDYNLMPPGTATPVSSDHENGLAKGGQPVDANASSQPKKEERGFFGSMVHGFGLFDSDDNDVVKPLPRDYNPGADINGIPSTPPHDAAPGTETAPAAAPAPAAETTTTTTTTATAQPKKEQRGFFGNLAHGFGLFDSDDDQKPAPPAPASDPGPAPDVNGTPQAPQKTSSATFHRESHLAMALMVDPDAAPAAGGAETKKPDYLSDFFSDMGSLVGIKPTTPKHYLSDDSGPEPAAPPQASAMTPASPLQPVNAMVDAPAPAPVQAAPRTKKSPDYIHDFFSDMGSLVGIDPDQGKQGGSAPTAK